jgi:hypothetical protein
MDMADGPVGVVRQRVDALDRQHRPFEGAHAVEGERHHHHADDRIGADLVPRPLSVISPLIMPPQLGIHSMIENTMPSVCAQSGSAV